MTSSGFTLIELMVTIAVLAIIVSIAAPNISNQLANQRVKSTTATLVNALKEAKVESVIRRQVITVTINNNSTNAGTLVLEDAKENLIGTYTYDAKSTISGKDSKNKAKSVSVFSPDKTADNEVTYNICDSNTSAAPRQIEVSKLAAINTELGGTC
ncbi:prepilin-type N-terminal cleavage/methylation domain-containing protein [Psychrobacter sp. FME5]|nr:prepilin-type N-terminal cleavage/methylation domain-containing protein [Psychrobacter sp. FME6]MBE0446261.1 prepilin-type N-terminal cleavage/methylation domain-containing protein [Psychrobacter sp. FME5]